MSELTYGVIDDYQPSDAAVDNKFGRKVAMSADGLVMAVGVINWSNGFTAVGAVYIWDWGGSAWTERGRIDSPTQANFANFGDAVSLSADGDTLIVGQYNETGGDGIIYTYQWSGSAWDSGTALNPPVTSNFEGFGEGVAISSDAQVLLVREVFSTNLTEASVTGNIYVYDWVSNAWSKRGTDLVPDSTTGNFGEGLFLSSDGDIAFVGNSSNGTGGEVEIYDYSSPNWNHRVTFTSSVIAGGDTFGFDVAYAENESTIVVGAPGEDETVSSAGAVFIFTLSGSIVTELGFIINPATQTIGDNFGNSVGVDEDYTNLAVGEPNDDITTNNSGSVHVFDPIVWVGVSNSTLPLTTITYGETTITGLSSSTLPLVAAGFGDNATLGAGDATIVLTAAGVGRFREDHLRQLNQEYQLPLSHTLFTRTLDHEHEIDAYLSLQRCLDHEYILNTYDLVQRYLDHENQLNAREEEFRQLNHEYSIFSVTDAIRQLNHEHVLDAFKLTFRKVNQEHTLDVYQSKQRQLNHEHSLAYLKSVTRSLNHEHALGAYEPRTRQLNHEHSISIQQIVTRYLNSEYSLLTAVEKIRQLNHEHSVDAYQETIRVLNQEYALDAYVTVIRFLDICYELDATGVFYAYSTNLETGATSEYTEFNFNSMSGDLACSDTDIFSLVQDDTNISISTSIETGKMDFGSSFLKRLTDAYLGMDSDGNLTLTVTTESGTTAYTLTGTSSLDTVKSNLARGHKGRYWKVKVENITGSSMNIDSIEVIPEILSRRR